MVGRRRGETRSAPEVSPAYTRIRGVYLPVRLAFAGRGFGYTALLLTFAFGRPGKKKRRGLIVILHFKRPAVEICGNHLKVVVPFPSVDVLSIAAFLLEAIP